MNFETKRLLTDNGREDLVITYEICSSGYGGVLQDGRIVDRREFPAAIPIPENMNMGIPPPGSVIGNGQGVIVKKSWAEFRETGLSWFVNTILHLFGWCLVFDLNEKGVVVACYPARTSCRGFDEQSTDEGYRMVTKYMKSRVGELQKEVLPKMSGALDDPDQ